MGDPGGDQSEKGAEHHPQSDLGGEVPQGGDVVPHGPAEQHGERGRTGRDDRASRSQQQRAGEGGGQQVRQEDAALRPGGEHRDCGGRALQRQGEQARRPAPAGPDSQESARQQDEQPQQVLGRALGGGERGAQQEQDTARDEPDLARRRTQVVVRHPHVATVAQQFRPDNSRGGAQVLRCAHGRAPHLPDGRLRDG